MPLSSFLSLAALVLSVAMEDTPDPSDEEWAEEELEEAGHEGVEVETLLVDDTGNEGTPSWGEAVQDEDDESSGLRDVTPSILAAWKGVLSSDLTTSGGVFDVDFDVHSYNLSFLNYIIILNLLKRYLTFCI